jgi:hypothetical protein
MEHYFGFGTTPGNQDGRSLLGFDLQDIYHQTPTPRLPFTASLAPAHDSSCNSVDSGLGLDGREPPKSTIYGQVYDGGSNSCPASPPGKDGSNANCDTSADFDIGNTYHCGLCDESARSISYSLHDFRRHQREMHGVTEHIQQPSFPVPKEAVSKTMKQIQEQRTPSEPGCV